MMVRNTPSRAGWRGWPNGLNKPKGWPIPKPAIHAVNYFGLWVGDQTRRALLGAPGSAETRGLTVLRLNNTVGLAEQMTSYPLFHAHEIRAFEGLMRASRERSA
jgi:hypothetical protein